MPSCEAPRCQHIKTKGTQCGSPALKDNLFCYYHQHCRTVTINYHQGYRDCSESELLLPVFEDAHSIQLTLRQVTELILRHKIDCKQAGLVLYALQIASSNLKRLERETPQPNEVVTDPPAEPPAEDPAEQEARRKAQHAEFEKAFPLDPKPEPKSNNDLPPGSIQACHRENEPRHNEERRRSRVPGQYVNRQLRGIRNSRVPHLSRLSKSGIRRSVFPGISPGAMVPLGIPQNSRLEAFRRAPDWKPLGGAALQRCDSGRRNSPALAAETASGTIPALAKLSARGRR